MSTEGGGPGYDENLDVFAGVRTFSMMYVILGHWQSMQAQSRSYNDVLEVYASWFGVFLQGGEYAVDAFFCMAAFLGTYVLLGKLAKSRPHHLAESSQLTYEKRHLVSNIPGLSNRDFYSIDGEVSHF